MKYFHISRVDLGESTKLKPKIPGSSLISEEGNIPRVCVCPSIYKCIEAIVSSSQPTIDDFLIEFRLETNSFDFATLANEDEELRIYNSPVVYYCEEIPYLPPRCSDFRRTKEHWYLKRTTFTRFGYLDLNQLIIDGKLTIVNNHHQVELKQKNIPNIKIKSR